MGSPPRDILGRRSRECNERTKERYSMSDQDLVERLDLVRYFLSDEHQDKADTVEEVALELTRLRTENAHLKNTKLHLAQSVWDANEGTEYADEAEAALNGFGLVVVDGCVTDAASGDRIARPASELFSHAEPRGT
jgi:hypothetical protein